MKIIIGLGNPGEKYKKTRHNIGFTALDLFAKTKNITIDKKWKEGQIYKGRNFILAKPFTYMNNSGLFVQKIMRFFNVTLEDILIIYDDMDLEVGRAIFRTTGGDGGHNGIKSIIYHLNSHQFLRMKIGIGRPKNKWNYQNYVLEKIPVSDQKIILQIMPNIFKALELLLADKKEKAIEFLNKQAKKNHS